MKPLSVAIVDDEPLAIERLSMAIAGIPDLHVCGTAGDGPSAAALVEAKSPAMLFLDIQMPGYSGLELARRLSPQGPIVIFTTAHRTHAADAFDLEAVDYLLKPIAFDRVRTAVDRARARLQDRGALRGQEDAVNLWVRERGSAFRLDLDRVERFEADRDYVKIYAEGRFWLIRDTLAGLEQRLDKSRFVRVHRSTLVSRSHIASIERHQDGVASIILRSGDTCRVGRVYRHQLKRLMC